MSNRIAVFNNGRVQQVGVPTEIYERPGQRLRRRIRRGLEPARAGRPPLHRPAGEDHHLRERRRAEGLHVEKGTISDIPYAGMVPGT